MQQSAVAYFTNGRIIVAPVSRTMSGDTIATDPKWFGKSAKKSVVAQSIGDALSGSHSGVADPTPEQRKRQFIPFQDAAAVKNFKTFMREARRVDIDRTGNTVVLTPSDNLGANNGFEPRPDDAKTVTTGHDEAVAAALLVLLGLRPDPASTSTEA